VLLLINVVLVMIPEEELEGALNEWFVRWLLLIWQSHTAKAKHLQECEYAGVQILHGVQSVCVLLLQHALAIHRVCLQELNPLNSRAVSWPSNHGDVSGHEC
jgi:hypothetical protein